MSQDPLVFDPATGRCGRVQLVVRWVLFSDGAVWPRRHGLLTYPEERVAADHAELLKKCRPNQVPADLEARAFWTYPDNFYPFQPVDQL